MWLDADRDIAAQQYETIRAGLIRIFVSKGCSDAEHLADKAIDIAIGHLPDLQDYIGEKAKYFFGVARYIILEQQRQREIAIEKFPELPIEPTEKSDAYECLIQCLKFLSHERRDLILDYYVHTGHDKVEYHKWMAEKLGITDGALRSRAFQVRARLEKSVLQCLQSLPNKKVE